MNDKGIKKSETEQEPMSEEAITGILLVEQPVRPDRVEIKVPRGVAVMQASQEWGTKIVLLGFPSAEKDHAGHGDANEGT